MDFEKTVTRIGSAIGARELVETIKDLRLDDALGVVGLERKPSSLTHSLPAIALITLSAAVGAAVALLLAPTSGRKLRARLSDGLTDAKHRLSDRISQLEIAGNQQRAVS